MKKNIIIIVLIVLIFIISGFAVYLFINSRPIELSPEQIRQAEEEKLINYLKENDFSYDKKCHDSGAGYKKVKVEHGNGSTQERTYCFDIENLVYYEYFNNEYYPNNTSIGTYYSALSDYGEQTWVRVENGAVTMILNGSYDFKTGTYSSNESLYNVATNYQSGIMDCKNEFNKIIRNSKTNLDLLK